MRGIARDPRGCPAARDRDQDTGPSSALAPEHGILRRSILTTPVASLLVRLVGALAFIPRLAMSQETASHAHVPVPTIAARAEDVSTIDGVITAYYDVITGPPGQPRQWSRDRTLYWPGLRFFSTNVKADGTPTVKVLSHQEYVDATDASLVKGGFDEHEIHRVSYRVGNIAHVMSTYETRQDPKGPLLARGVNSLDLYWDGTRWWITAASWDDERPGSPIPPELLK